MLGLSRKKYSFVRLGDLNERARVENVLGIAQQTQSAFEFDFLPYHMEVPSKYRLLNGSYDLDSAIRTVSKLHRLPNPAIFITSLPYGDRATAKEKDSFWFGATDFDDGGAVISTYPIESGACKITLESYILMMTATTIFSDLGRLEFHPDTEGRLFDYCDELKHAETVFRGAPGLCKACEQSLHAQLRYGGISNLQVASARRLCDRARNIRRCFLAMPFARHFDAVWSVISDAVLQAGWQIARADQIARPRRITDAIIQGIMACDLLLADISGNNPNVFYEIGYAHASGCDVILLCQRRSRPVPFDIAQERAIFYTSTQKGLIELKRNLKHAVDV